MMDGPKTDAFMIWALVISTLCLSGVLREAVYGLARALAAAHKRYRRARLRRRNLGVVRRIQVLQGIESGVDSR
jgi:hypothetical protein